MTTEIAEARQPAVTVQNLSKSIGGIDVLSDVSLTVESGEVLGFVGPNGAGKTTTLRAVLGLVTPDNGTVRLFGSRPRQASLDRVGVVFEYETLKPSWTVRDNLLVTCHVYELPASRIDRCLDRAQLDPAVADATFDTLSKGMKRKVSLADALLPDPELLVVDEPISGLDPASRDAILELLEESACTVLFSSHALSDVQRVCDRVAIIRDGRTVVETPLDESVKAVWGSYPDLEAAHVAGDCYLPDEKTIARRDLPTEEVDVAELYFAIEEADG